MEPAMKMIMLVMSNLGYLGWLQSSLWLYCTSYTDLGQRQDRDKKQHVGMRIVDLVDCNDIRVCRIS